MPVQGNYGTESTPWSNLTSEQIVLTPRTSDPSSPTEGDMWLRTDLDSGQKIATARFQHGSGTWDIPVFATAETTGNDVKKVLGVQTPNGEGFIPLQEGGGAFNQLGFQHGGARHGVHNDLTATPASGVSRWKFDEGSGSTATDSWGSNNGTITGATYTASAKVGTHALDFDGTNDAVTVGNDPSLDLANMSFATWVYPRDVSNIQEVARRWQGSGSESWIFRMNDEDSDGTNEVRVDIRVGGSSFIASGSTNIAQNAWNHLGWTYDGETVRVYLDGSMDGENTSPSGALDVNDEPLNIGQNGADSAVVDGRIDDPRLYDKALTSTEMSNLESTGSIA